MLLALFHICIIILRQKGTEYFNLALRFIICLFLDLPNTLGTKNWVMRSYILQLKTSYYWGPEVGKKYYFWKLKCRNKNDFFNSKLMISFTKGVMSLKTSQIINVSPILSSLNETLLGSKIQTVLGI